MAGVVHEESRIAPVPELETSTVRPTQISIEKSHYTIHRPTSVLENSNLIDLLLMPSDDYTKLDESLLTLEVEVEMKKDGSHATVGDWKALKCCNYLMHSMFKNIEVTLGDKIITQSNNTYPYRAETEASIGFNKCSKETHLALAFWDEDEENRSKKIRVEFPAGTASAATTDATLVTKDSVRFKMMGRLHFDLTFQDRAIVPNTPIRIKLFLHEPSFYLKYSTITPTIKIIDAEFRAMRCKPTSDQIKSLKVGNKNHLYPVCRMDLKVATINPGSTNYNIDNLIIGTVPKRMFIKLVKNKAFNGDKGEDCLGYDNFKLNYAAAQIDGETFPYNGYRPDFTTPFGSMDVYWALLSTIREIGPDTMCHMTFEKFKNAPIIPITFTPSIASGCGYTDYVHPVKTGIVDLKLGFAEPPSESINVIAICEYDNVIEILPDRTVRTGYN